MLPPGFIHPYQSFKFIQASLPEGGIQIGGDGAVGIRYSWKLFCIEYHTSDEVPTLEPMKGFRLVVWNRITRKEWGRGWYPMFTGFEWPAHAFSDIRGTEEYWKSWSTTAQQSRRKWLTQKDYEVVALKRDHFVDAYRKSGRLASLHSFFIKLLDRAIRIYDKNVYMWVVRHVVTKDIVAGMAAMHAHELSQSRDIMSFLSGKDVPPYAGLALIDHWFAHCKDSGIAFPHFGIVWTKGQPKTWKGFTQFKKQFNPHVLVHPRSLFKLTVSFR